MSFGSAVDRMQAMVPVSVWGEPTSGSALQVSALCMGTEIQNLWDTLDWIVDQSYPALADENGLSYWEQLLSLPLNPTSLTTEQRRAVVQARRHVAGPVQIPSILALIAQYQRGTAHLIWDAPNSVLTVTWDDIRGAPDNIADVQAALDKYLPAWIAINYLFTYLTWDQLTATGKSWDEITADALTWDELVVSLPGDL